MVKLNVFDILMEELFTVKAAARPCPTFCVGLILSSRTPTSRITRIAIYCSRQYAEIHQRRVVITAD